MRSLVLLRGIPGCGKSSLAEALTEGDEKGRVFSADDYFTNEKGEYNFDITKRGIAHIDCHKRTEEAMILGMERIFIADTFTRESEMKPYYDLGKKYDYRVYSVVVENRHNGKNVHKVPEEVIEGMRERFKVQL